MQDDDEEDDLFSDSSSTDAGGSVGGAFEVDSSPDNSQLPSQHPPSSQRRGAKGQRMYVHGRYRTVPALCQDDELAAIDALYAPEGVCPSDAASAAVCEVD
jgi:hypothetical protein